MREQLVGYLCGALDDHEHADVERRVAADPQLRGDLELLSGALAPLAADGGHHAPPIGLAAKTCDAIFANSRLPAATLPTPKELHPTGQHPSSGRRRTVFVESPAGLVRRNWRMIDSAIALGAIAAAALLFFPALVQSRYLAQMAQCQNNLETVGDSLARYAQQGPERGFYPSIPRSGNQAFAGIYGVRLLENGFLDSAKHLVCPSSPQAKSGKPLVVPTSADLNAATGEQLAEYQRTAGGSYGYSLGFVQDGWYFPTQFRQTRWNPILADAFDPTDNKPNSCNHGGCGQNVLFADGRVGYLSTCQVVDRAGDETIDDDDIFRNARREIAAGLGRYDFVLGDSASNPWTGHAEIKIPAFLRNAVPAPTRR
jgi:hypothetical protein